MKKLFTLLMLFVAIVTGVKAASGDVLFSQNFNSATAVAYDAPTSSTAKTRTYDSTNPLTNLVGTGSNSNLFTSIATSIKKGDIAINSTTGGNGVDATGIFQVYGSNDNAVYWSLNRTANFAETAPTALKVSMKIWYKNIGSGSNTGISFAVGSEFGDKLTNSRQENTKVHSGFGITHNSSPKLTVYNSNTTIYNTAISQSKWLTITWVVNNSGSALDYDDPSSSTSTVNDDCYDLWIDNTKVVSNQAATTAAQTLQNIYIGNKEGKSHEFRLDDLVVTDLTPASGPVAVTGVTVDKTASVEVDKTVSLTATVAPANATNKNVTWSSDDETVATVENGIVTGVAAGTANITVTTEDGEYTDVCEVTVTAPKCATPTISPVSFSTDNQEVTITSETAGATIYYTTDGATPSTNSLVYDSEDKPTISSTTTFKAIAVKENYDNSEVATQKITRTSSAVVASWDFTNWSSTTQAGVRADGTNWRDYETSKTDKPLNDKVYSNKGANATFVYSETTIPETKGLSFATTAYTFGLAFDQASTTIGTYHGSEYLWLYGGNSIIIIPSLTAGQTIEIGLESHKKDGTSDATRTLTVTNTNEGSYSTEAYTEQTFTVTADGDVTISPSKGMHIYYIKVTGNAETVPVSTVGSNNYATYVTESNLDFSSVSDKITAYIATADNGSTITTEAVTEVPAGTALLIKTANAGSTVNVPVAASTPATLTANKLKYSASPLVITSEQATAKQYYGFFKVGEKYGFAPMAAGTLAAKKAYLDYGVGGNSLQFIALDFDDAPTAINFIEAENNANSTVPVKVIKNGKLYIGNYNVAGQQVK